MKPLITITRPSTHLTLISTSIVIPKSSVAGSKATSRASSPPFVSSVLPPGPLIRRGPPLRLRMPPIPVRHGRRTHTASPLKLSLPLSGRRRRRAVSVIVVSASAASIRRPIEVPILAPLSGVPVAASCKGQRLGRG
uniref:Serrate RNA effector molecule-like n=1 Tax=Rhizophora mucronata TaxID=61149 RepID=A0A2P2ML39_RHIMU